MVVVMLGLIDIVFAVDSIPAVFSIIPDPSKNCSSIPLIFLPCWACAASFLLRGAASKFDYLQQGIAIVLIYWYKNAAAVAGVCRVCQKKNCISPFGYRYW